MCDDECCGVEVGKIMTLLKLTLSEQTSPKETGEESVTQEFENKVKEKNEKEQGSDPPPLNYLLNNQSRNFCTPLFPSFVRPWKGSHSRYFSRVTMPIGPS